MNLLTLGMLETWMKSNGLERYNRKMKYYVFPTMHSALPIFAENLKVEAERVAQCNDDVRKGREEDPTYKEVIFPVIPDEYYKFRNFEKSPSKKRRSKRKGVKD